MIHEGTEWEHATAFYAVAGFSATLRELLDVWTSNELMTEIAWHARIREIPRHLARTNGALRPRN